MNKNTIPLCTQCASFELSSWLNEKQMKANLARAIREELRYLSLAEGNCIVCNNNSISYGWMERILKIMKKYQAPEEIRKEFIKMFGFEEK